MAGHAKKKKFQRSSNFCKSKNKQKKNHNKKKKLSKSETKQTSHNQHSRWQPLPKTLLLRDSNQMLSSGTKGLFFSHFYLRIIRFPELTECWKEQTILKQQNSKLHKTTQTMYKTLLKQKNWTTRPFTCNVSVSNVKSSDLKKQTKNKNGVRAFSHPLRSPSPNHPQLFWRQAG